MDRRGFLKATAMAAAAGQAYGQPPEKPNILFLIADDLTFRAVRALGNSQVATPSIDRLMSRGTTFSHCFHQGSWSAAVCMPSRTMLNSGLTAFRARHEFENAPLWGETFGRAGYDTYLIGKWHLSDAALARSFQRTGPVSPGMFESGPDAYHRPSAGDRWVPWDTTRKGQWLETAQWQKGAKAPIKHSAEIWAEGAIDHLRGVARADKPFFLYVGFNSPHDPRQAPRAFVDRYPRERISIPPSYLPGHPFDNGEPKIRDELLAPFPRTREAVRLHRSEYYAHITYMDEQIGRILDALDASGKAANTYVVLTADHGLAVGEHGLMGKQNLYEHSVRMPYVIAGPGIPAGRSVDAMIYQHSTFATTCELAGIPVPGTVEFPSLGKLLRGESSSLHDAVFCWYRDLQRSVRTEEHKLIVYPKAGVTQLFDLRKDPWETAELSADPKYGAIRNELLERLRRFQMDLGDDICRPV